MPSHDETSPGAPRAGSVRRPTPSRSRPTGGGGGRDRSGRPPAGGRARTTASRTGPSGPSRAGGAARGGRAGTSAKGKGPRSKKQRRNRRLQVIAGALAAMLVLLGVFVGVVYASTDVPSPDSITTAQTTRIYY
ncbi:MAG: penicillin-binding protein, partial [Blastococcus sp.]